MDIEQIQNIFQAQDERVVLAGDAESAMEIVRKKREDFSEMILTRDSSEIGTALCLIAIYWIFFRSIYTSPIPLCLATGFILLPCVFLVVDRIWQRRGKRKRNGCVSDELNEYLRQVNHQIWLLRNVIWWYLMPLAISSLAVIAGIAIQFTAVWDWIQLTTLAIMVCGICWGAYVNVKVYRLNQEAVEKQLLPHKEELEALLRDLQGEEAPQ